MNCKDAPELIPVYVDGELDTTQAEALEAHLRGCTECTRLAEGERGWRRTVQAGATRYTAPDRLRARLAVALAEADATTPPAPTRFVGWRPLAMAASLALAVVTSSGLTAYVMQSAEQDSLVQDVVSGHVRSLMAGHLTDVLSSDQHTVKPWFHGRIDLAPPVDDLAGDGYPLVGGRLDYLDHLLGGVRRRPPRAQGLRAALPEPERDAGVLAADGVAIPGVTPDRCARRRSAGRRRDRQAAGPICGRSSSPPRSWR